MASKDNLACWAITNCRDSENCLAKKYPDRDCWEIASEVNDHRSAFEICEDCIVFLLKGKDSSLSNQEKKSIIAHKVECALAAA